MDDDWAKEIGKRLAQARDEAHLTQEQVAELLERSTGAVSNWERATRTPSFAEIRRLAEATNSDLRWLVFGASYQDPLDQMQADIKQILARLSASRKAEATAVKTERKGGERGPTVAAPVPRPKLRAAPDSPNPPADDP